MLGIKLKNFPPCKVFPLLIRSKPFELQALQKGGRVPISRNVLFTFLLISIKSMFSAVFNEDCLKQGSDLAF